MSDPLDEREDLERAMPRSRHKLLLDHAPNGVRLVDELNRHMTICRLRITE